MRGAGRLVTGSVRASARGIAQSSVKAWAVPGISATASTTDKSGLNLYLHVTPTEPQQLVWLVPQVGIDYYVSTSTGLKWQIK